LRGRWGGATERGLKREAGVYQEGRWKVFRQNGTRGKKNGARTACRRKKNEGGWTRITSCTGDSKTKRGKKDKLKGVGSKGRGTKNKQRRLEKKKGQFRPPWYKQKTGEKGGKKKMQV